MKKSNVLGVVGVFLLGALGALAGDQPSGAASADPAVKVGKPRPVTDDPTARRKFFKEWYEGGWSAEFSKHMNQAAARERRAWAGLMAPPDRAPLTSITPPVDGVWANIGPTRSDFITNGGTTLNEIDTGRPRDIIVDPGNPSTIYVAMSGGGLWKTTDAGATWAPKSETLGSLSIGALAMDPANSSVLYLGLGDPFDGTGVGLVKSTDGGDTWGAVRYLGGSTRITSLQVGRTDTNIVLATTDAGLFRSADGGTSWNTVTLATGFPTGTQQAWDIEWAGGQVFVASLEASYEILTGTTNGQIWRTANNGANWTRSTGVTDAGGVGRISIAVSPANTNVMYAMAAVPNAASPDLADFYRSSDNGVSWTAFGVSSTTGVDNAVGGGPSYNPYNKVAYVFNGQGWYDHMLVAHPTDPYTFFYGGALRMDRAVSTNSGGSWTYTAMSDWLAQLGRPYVHADFHSATFDPSGVFYVGTDGGIFKSTDILTAAAGTHTFTSALNEGIVSHLLYSVGSTAATGGVDRVIGGLQDNGTRVRAGATTTFNQVIGGDGFAAHIHAVNPNLMLGSLYYAQIRKSTNGGSTFTAACTGLTECGGAAPFATKLAAFTGDATGNTIYTISNTKVYKSTNYAGSWASIGTIVTSGSLRNVGVSPTNSNYVGAVASGGRVFVTSNGGTSWTQTAALPNNGLSMSSIAFDPATPTTIYVTSVAPVATATHAWRSTDLGASWAAIDTSGLPAGVPVNEIQFDPTDGNILYAATHLGVYRSTNAGTSWVRFGSGMPLVQVSQLYVSPDGTLVRASSYGRGFWQLGAPPVSSIPTTLTVAPATGTFGGTVSLSATLTVTAGGAGVASNSVAFSLNGTSVGTATTDGSGVATLANVSLSGIGAGSYPGAVTASFAGDSTYAASNGSATLTVSQATQTITVNTSAPASASNGSSFTVDATATSGLAVAYGSAGSCSNVGATYTITSATGACTVTYDQAGDADYQAAPQVTQTVNATAGLSILDGGINETNATQLATFTVTLPGGAASPVTVNWATGVIGGATSGADYTPASGSLTFNAGQTAATFTVAVAGDLADEGPEYFYANLSAAAGAAIADGQARFLISDDDPAAVLAFGNLAEPINTEGDDALIPSTFTVTLTGPTERTVDVEFASGTAGTATSGVDYEAKSGTLRFTPGQTSKEFVIRIIGDLSDEARETFYVNLSNPLNGTIGDTQAMGTIVDNDPTPAGSPNLAIGNATVTETDAGVATATFTLTLSAASAQAVTVTYGTGAGGTATSGVDYAAFILRTTTIAAGQLTKTITVTVNPDDLVEANETFFVNVTSASNAVIVDAQGQGTILNDDTP